MVETRPAEGVDGFRCRHCCLPSRCRAAAPPASDVTPALIEAAQEGRQGVVLHGARTQHRRAAGADVRSEISRASAVRVERSGAERIFQRIAQEQGSGINAVDIANSTDPRITSNGRRTTGLRRTSPRLSQNIFWPISSTPTVCMRPPAPGWKRSATTPIW